MLDLSVDNLCALFYDFYSRSGFDEFMYCAEEFISEDGIDLFERAVELGRTVEVEFDA